MNYITIFLLFTFLGLNSFSQNQDTCDMVSQNNEIGGLDCAVVSTNSAFTPDSYQWLDCDSSYIEISGQTTNQYFGSSSNYVALVLSYLGCTDTSYCYPICHYGVEEFQNNNKKRLKTLDALGRETKDEPNKLLIFIYSDGTTEKVFRIE